MPDFKLNPAYTATADQPQAIAELSEGLSGDDRFQTLLGGGLLPGDLRQLIP